MTEIVSGLVLGLLTASADGQAELDRLAYLLEARSAAMGSIMLEYEILHGDETDRGPWTERGVWFMGGEKRACVAVSGYAGAEPGLVWSYWGGVDGYLAGGPSSWDRNLKELLTSAPAFDTYEHTSCRSQGQLSYGYLPDRLGHGIANVSWGQYLGSFSDLRVLGREEISGVDCLKVVMDMDQGVGDTAYSFPWVVHFDDTRSLLAMEVTLYGNPEGSHPDGVPEDGNDVMARKWIRLDGRWWRSMRTTTVEEAHEIEPGVWIGTRGHIVQHLGSEPSRTDVVVDPLTAELNRGTPTWMASGFTPIAPTLLRR